MKNMRLPLFIMCAVTIIGIILGSFFDYQISSAVASSTNYFGLTVSAICPTLGFAGVAVMGGGFIALIIKGEYPVWLKIIFGILAACCYGVAVYYPGGEYFGVNGFYGAAPEWIGYLIVFLPEAGAVVGGYFLFKDCQNKNIWIVFCTIIGLLLIALLLIIPQLKDNIRRPRFRTLVEHGEIPFRNWWQSSKGDYKNWMQEYGIESSDHFKSYPSGHTAETSILLVVATFFPLAHKKMHKYQMPCFLAACFLVLLVAFARILAAAHFLSDVSWGAFIVNALATVANEIVMKIKPLQVAELDQENS